MRSAPMGIRIQYRTIQETVTRRNSRGKEYEEKIYKQIEERIWVADPPSDAERIALRLRAEQLRQDHPDWSVQRIADQIRSELTSPEMRALVAAVKIELDRFQGAHPGASFEELTLAIRELAATGELDRLIEA